MSEASAPKRVARRTVAKGAAWTVPAVVIAAPAASAAASPPDPIDPTYEPGTFCKHAPSNHYHAEFCFQNTSDQDIEITFVDFLIQGSTGGAFTSVTGAITPTTITVESGEECCVEVDANDSAMANGKARLEFSYPYGGQTLYGDVETEFNNNISNCHQVGEPNLFDDAHVRACS